MQLKRKQWCTTVLEKVKTKSTGAVHTSAKTRLTGVAMRIRDRHQNFIICSLAHYQPSLKISRKSVQQFLYKVANIIAALLTYRWQLPTMLVQFIDPVSRYVIE